MILFIDNFDSFTYNIVQDLRLLKQKVQVFRNDEITLLQCISLNPSHIIIGPGPKTPKESGISIKCVQHFSKKIPILGICLGHQVLAEVFGAKIIRAPKVLHGKTSRIHHTEEGLFEKVAQDVQMMRYNSLVIDKNTLPYCFKITSISLEDQQIMSISHRDLPLEGIQFHPESFLSAETKVFTNFLKMSNAPRSSSPAHH